MTVPSTINWTQVQTRPTLMIPGPTELPFPVIQAMNQPSAIQYDRSFDEGVLEPTTLALRDVFQTKSEVIIMPGSGRTALEAGALSIIEPRSEEHTSELQSRLHLVCRLLLEKKKKKKKKYLTCRTR